MRKKINKLEEKAESILAATIGISIGVTLAYIAYLVLSINY